MVEQSENSFLSQFSESFIYFSQKKSLKCVVLSLEKQNYWMFLAKLSPDKNKSSGEKKLCWRPDGADPSPLCYDLKTRFMIHPLKISKDVFQVLTSSFVESLQGLRLKVCSELEEFCLRFVSHLLRPSSQLKLFNFLTTQTMLSAADSSPGGSNSLSVFEWLTTICSQPKTCDSSWHILRSS